MSIEFFSEAAGRYGGAANERFYRTIADGLLEKVPASIDPKSILEVGAGTGFATAPIRARWPKARITALEPAAGMLKIGRAVATDIDWRADRLADFQGSKYDLVVASMSYHWLTPAEREKLIFLAGQGALALAVPISALRQSGSLSKKTPAQLALLETVHSLRVEPGWPRETRRPEVLLEELSAKFKQVAASELTIDEVYEKPSELIESLSARGALEALFGRLADAAATELDGRLFGLTDITFSWAISLTIASNDNDLPQRPRLFG